MSSVWDLLCLWCLWYILDKSLSHVAVSRDDLEEIVRCEMRPKDKILGNVKIKMGKEEATKEIKRGQR